jgi:uridylate kinase
MRDRRFVVICGGGSVCRRYQEAARRIGVDSENDLDWIGIRATRLNAELVKAAFGHEAHERVIHDPDEKTDTEKRIIIGAGFEPGSSTDLRAVQLAARMDAAEVVNMSNIDHVYTADPKKDPDAEKIKAMTWPQFRKLVGEDWDPGMNLPFDPVASREAEARRLRVMIIGNDLENLRRVLAGEAFEGTTIS